jgi:hypothetical protein
MSATKRNEWDRTHVGLRVTLVAAIAALAVIMLWLQRGESTSVDLTSGSEAVTEIRADAEHERIAAPPDTKIELADARVPLEVEQPHQVRLEQPWIHSAPDLQLSEMKGREILAAYWGEQWPTVSEYFGDRLSLVDTYWAGENEKLGQPEDVLNDIVEDILADLDDGGGRPRSIAIICLADPSPFKPSAVFSATVDRARRFVGGSLLERQKLELTVVRQQDYLNEIASVIDELSPLWIDLDAAVRRLVVEQLSGLDRHTKPELGHLTLNPLFNFGPPPEIAAEFTASGGRPRWVAPFTARSRDRMQCKFVAQWCVDLRLDPSCARAIEAIASHEATVQSRLDEIAQRMAAELQ